MDFATIAQFGPTGLAIVAFYGIYKLFDQERKRNEDRLDARDAAMRELEHDIRERLSAQLMENTNALEENTAAKKENTKVMETVIGRLSV
jgi:C4-dicarboxylate-specific signal transduction histidine kinase